MELWDDGDTIAWDKDDNPIPFKRATDKVKAILQAAGYPLDTTPDDTPYTICKHCGYQKRCHLWPDSLCPQEADNQTGRTSGRYQTTKFEVMDESSSEGI